MDSNTQCLAWAATFLVLQRRLLLWQP